jgi:hypothetical protein
MKTTAIFVAVVLLAGCSVLSPNIYQPDYCLIGKDMKRAPLTPEQQQVCIYGNKDANSGYYMFSRPAWGQANDFAVQTGPGNQYR